MKYKTAFDEIYFIMQHEKLTNSFAAIDNGKIM